MYRTGLRGYAEAVTAVTTPFPTAGTELVGDLIDRLAERPDTRSLPVGLFRASTGAAAALVTAAARPEHVHAAELRVVPGATHLFEEPRALEIVAEEAGTWFATRLR